ncbi:MAG TPA: MarC family protein [Myxococcota bacterium]|nr:MarC family protein [Myxococcota bacterium]
MDAGVLSGQLLQAVAAVLAIANPVGSAPLFLLFVEGLSRAEKRQAAGLASFAVLAILGASALLGPSLLALFGLQIASFQAAGGLVIALMGLEMLRGEPTRIHSEAPGNEDPQDRILIPFAMPLVAGPGAITTVITLAVTQSRGRVPLEALVASIVTAFVLWLMLLLVIAQEHLITPRIRRLFTRFMGLILLAIGFQLGLRGVKSFFMS